MARAASACTSRSLGCVGCGLALRWQAVIQSEPVRCATTLGARLLSASRTGGPCWIRTSDFRRVKATLSR